MRGFILYGSATIGKKFCFNISHFLLILILQLSNPLICKICFHSHPQSVVLLIFSSLLCHSIPYLVLSPSLPFFPFLYPSLPFSPVLPSPSPLLTAHSFSPHSFLSSPSLPLLPSLLLPLLSHLLPSFLLSSPPLFSAFLFFSLLLPS